jgi:8-amino-7-oxononanoate synthase
MSPVNRFERRIRARLAELERAGLHRTLHEPCGIDLSSNDYLNLAADPRVTAAFCNAARDGVGSTGSRLLRGHRSGFDRLESHFAAFKGAERAIYFSSGYLANLAVLATLAERGDTIVSDARNHASLIDGIRLSRARVVIAPHNDAAALRRALEESANPAPAAAVPAAEARDPLTFVVVESLYSMEGDFAPLADCMAACDAFGAVLIVDEAHAVGIYGPNGEGAITAAGLDANRCLSINTAGKALGAAGALVAGPGWAIDYLVQRARPFVFSTAAPPAIAAAIETSLTIVASEPERRQRVLDLAAHLRAALRKAGVDAPDGTSQIIPIIVGDNERAVSIAQGLQAEGFDVRAIRPPSVPEGTARLRISVNAGLTERALDQFAGLVSAALCSAACS